MPPEAAALSRWRTRAPLLVMPSHDWSVPNAAGQLACGTTQQAAVLEAAKPRCAGVQQRGCCWHWLVVQESMEPGFWLVRAFWVLRHAAAVPATDPMAVLQEGGRLGGRRRGPAAGGLGHVAQHLCRRGSTAPLRVTTSFPLPSHVFLTQRHHRRWRQRPPRAEGALACPRRPARAVQLQAGAAAGVAGAGVPPRPCAGHLPHHHCRPELPGYAPAADGRAAWDAGGPSLHAAARSLGTCHASCGQLSSLP